MIIRPKSPLGLKYLQIVPGHSSEGLRRRRNDPDQRRQARTGRHRPVLRHLRRKDPLRDPPERGRLRQRPRRSRPGAERRPRQPCANWPKAPKRRSATWSPPRPTSPASGGRWRTSTPTIAPVAAGQRRPLRRPRPDLRRLRPRLAALHPGNDLEGPGDARHRDRRPSRPAAVPARLRTVLHRLPAGGEGARRNLADDRRGGARRHPGAARIAGLRRPARADRQGPGRLPGSAGRLQRPRPADRHQRSPRTRRSSSSRRRRRPATTSPSPSATWPAPSTKATARPPGSAAISFQPPGGPNSEGLSGLGPRQRRRPNSSLNHLHYNPYPNTASPGPADRSAKPATSTT